ncbi:hypothetical protein Pcinc_043643 [Petrolisthes cinctipes]|uniref:Secreted protein n=1 Tax=Petrolisthes cinctipes TaxID=88211 RepID=A0AAE1BIS2_PETCI|nr:hypothetical protein Pcinc_043643 [Petrolisthes cinctipes]
MLVLLCLVIMRQFEGVVVVVAGCSDVNTATTMNLMTGCGQRKGVATTFYSFPPSAAAAAAASARVAPPPNSHSSPMPSVTSYLAGVSRGGREGE